MIYVTQGHENGVGLELFIKSLLCLNNNSIEKFVLITSKAALSSTMESLNLKYELNRSALSLGTKKIKLITFEASDLPQSSQSLEIALERISPKDILLTLPTSKDQLIFENQKVNGYTEYFRKKYSKPDITMNFLALTQNVLLLTDHISITEVVDNLSSKIIIQKVSTTLENLSKLRHIDEVYFSGIDPHCGEGGQISTFDNVFDTAIKALKSKFVDIKFSGPFPADTLHLKFNNQTNQLFVYPAHDQGLGPFKLKNGLVGINLSLGLPFLRVSVDHGTAFDLYGKNKANYLSLLYLIEEITKWT